MNKKRWVVQFIDLAYDGGGSESWTQEYRTKLGAIFSKLWHLHVASWGGEARLHRRTPKRGH